MRYSVGWASSGTSHLNPEEIDIEQVRNQTRRDVRDHVDPHRGTRWR